MVIVPAALIFDLDGTLLDTLADLADASNAALEMHGFPAKPLSAYRHYVGDGAHNMMRRATQSDTADINALVAEMMRRYASGWANKSVPYTGIEDMLRALSTMRVPLCVLSNKPHEFTQLVIRHFFPTLSFVSITGHRQDFPLKPDPKAALGIAEELGLAPERMAFVGDSKTDMQTAVNAGMIPLGVSWGFRDEQELREHGARVVVHAPSEIVEICRSGLPS